MIRILHISDLHLCESVEPRLLLRIREALKSAAKRGERIDLIIVSGDLTAGGRTEEYAAVRMFVLEPAMHLFGLGSDRVILVPGNHDVNRELRDDVDRAEEKAAGLDPFREFCLDFYGDRPPSEPGPLSLVYTPMIDNTSVGIAALNSTLTRSDGKEGQLLLDRQQVRPALQAISDRKIRLVVAHHPLDWLAPRDAIETRSELARSGAIFFVGHLHIPVGTSLRSTQGRIHALTARCLNDPSGLPAGYSLVNLDASTQTGTVTYCRWYDQREEFDDDPEIAPRGRETFHLPRSRQESQPGDPESADVLREIAKQAARLTPRPSRDRPQAHSIDDVLVGPRLLDDQGNDVDLKSALRGPTVTVVSGHPRAGVSSAQYRLLAEHYRLDPSRVPAYLSSRDAGGLGTAKDEATIGRAAGELGFHHIDLQYRLLILCCDDLDRMPARRRERILSFIARNTDNRYVLGCRAENAAKLLHELEQLGIDARHLSIATCGPDELVGLARAIPGTEHVDLEQVATTIRDHDLPRVPGVVLGVIAAAAGSAEAPSGDGNGDLLSSYVQWLLSHRAPERRARASTGRQFRELLGELAGEIHRTDEDSLPTHSVERLVFDYLDERGLPQPERHLLTELCRREVLSIKKGRVSFRHPAVFHLFVAEGAINQPERIATLLDDCHRNRRAIRHLARARRADAEILAAVLRHAETEIDRAPSTSAAVVDRSLTEIRPKGHRTVMRLEAMHNLVSPRTLQSLIDAKHDRLTAAFNCARGAPDELPEDPIGHIAEAVALLSDTLACAELVADVGLKHRALAVALRGWAVLCGIMIATDGEHSQLFRAAILEGVDTLLGKRALGEDSEEVLQAAIALTACCIVMRESLATHQLTAILDATLDDDEINGSPTVAFLATWLRSELERGGAPRRIRHLAGRLERESLLWDALLSAALKHYRGAAGDDVHHLEETLIDEVIPKTGAGRVAMRQEKVRQKYRRELVHARRVATNA